jgi:hypothetical protein
LPEETSGFLTMGTGERRGFTTATSAFLLVLAFVLAALAGCDTLLDIDQTPTVEVPDATEGPDPSGSPDAFAADGVVGLGDALLTQDAADRGESSWRSHVREGGRGDARPTAAGKIEEAGASDAEEGGDGDTEAGEEEPVDDSEGGAAESGGDEGTADPIIGED